MSNTSTLPNSDRMKLNQTVSASALAGSEYSFADAIHVVTSAEDKAIFAGLEYRAQQAPKLDIAHPPMFAGQHVVLYVPKSKEGKRMAAGAGKTLHGVAASVHVIEIPNIDRKPGSVAAWVSGGLDLSDLETLVRPYEPKSNGKRFKTMTDLLSMADTEPDFLVDELIERGSFIVLYGESGAGKSFAAVDLMLHIAAGRPWCGFQTVQSPVLYSALEGERGISRRIKAAMRHHKMDTATVDLRISAEPVDFANGDDDITEFIRNARDEGVPKVGVVVIDTLNRAFGGADENSAAAMSVFVENVRRIQRELDCAVVVVHHSGKNASSGMRGSSALKAAADTVVVLTADKDENGTAIGQVQLSVEKQKDGAPIGPFDFELKQVPLGKKKSGRELSTCVLVPISADDARQRASAHKPLSEQQRAAMLQLVELQKRKPRGDMLLVPSRVTAKEWQAACIAAKLFANSKQPSKSFAALKSTLAKEGHIKVSGDRVEIVDPDRFATYDTANDTPF